MLVFYDFDFNTLFAEPKLISARWSLFYNNIGTFEVHLPLNSRAAELIGSNRRIVAADGGKSAIIVGYEAGDDLTLYGRTCNWLLSKRTLGSVKKQKAGAGSICCSLVKTGFSDTASFAQEPWSSTADTVEFEKTSPVLLSDAVRECLALKGLGHSVDFDVRGKRWLFRICEGRKLDLIISEGNKNAYNTRVQGDILDLATCGYYNDGTNRILYNPDPQTGILRWETELSAASSAEAAAELAEKKENNGIRLMTRNISFGEDYQLGDIVRVQIIKGSFRTTQKKRIIGAELRFGDGAWTQQPIFEDI